MTITNKCLIVKDIDFQVYLTVTVRHEKCLVGITMLQLTRCTTV